ncbi:MAG: efflux RND transporter periplasmic adaptor subunit [Agathobacter sp.]|nr:efflux RND transporter periplasmic adaptor subunit [Agathobacter sp.]
MRKGTCLIAFVLAGTILSGGCSVLPKQTVEHPNVVVEAVEETGYNLAQVERGNIYLTQKLFFLYAQTTEEALHFETGGRRVESVYAKVGDEVKKGQLLAELYSEDLQTDLDNYYYQKEYYERLNAQAEELYAYDYAKVEQAVETGVLTEAEGTNQKALLKQSLTDTTDTNDDTLTIIELRIQELETQLAGCKIYAGIDGVVTFILPRLGESTSDEDVTVYRIINSDECLFRLENSEYGNRFEGGQAVHIQINDELGYDTTVKRIVASDEVDTTAGQPASDTYTVYLEPDEIDSSLEVGTRGYVTLVLDERHDVLYLPNSCIYTADDRSYVFVENADGMQSIQNVTVGMKGDSYTEIIDGLGEGDVVIRK